MCRRQFGSTRACYTPIKEREGVLPQGGLVHLPWPQKGLTFTPWCWHDLQTRSLCCLGGYWNCLEETCSGPNRQAGRNHIFYIRDDLSAVSWEERRYGFYWNIQERIVIFARIWQNVIFQKDFCQIHWMLEHDMTSISPLKSPALNKLTNTKATK